MLPLAVRAQLDLVSLAGLPGSYICVVLHHGDDRWSARSEFASMLDAGQDAIEAMRELTPHVLGRLTQIVSWTSSSAERFEQAAPLTQELPRTTTRDASTRALSSQLYAYLLQVLKDVDGDKCTVNFLKLQDRKDERTL